MAPYSFDAFFQSDRTQATSPFLTPKSRRWAKHLELKKAFASLFFLVLSFAFTFYSSPLSLFFLTIVYFLSGTSAILGTMEDIFQLEINIDTLMTLAAFVSLFLGSELEGALLLVLFELSGAMEESVTKKAGSALYDLTEITPQNALVIGEQGGTMEKSVREIRLGEKILVKVGEYVPLDGIIIEGNSLFDLSHLTGESLPVRKTLEETVPAGARNTNSGVVISVTKTSSESTLSRMIQLMREASTQKPKMQKTLDQFGKRYAAFVMLSSALLALGLPMLFSLPYLGVEGSIYRALTFLITASPCALIIGAPTAYLAAVSSCAKKGILIKGGAVLDALSTCKGICFDKTGTLTSGQVSITKFSQIKGPPFPTEEALVLVKSLERQVKHPLASAIDRYTPGIRVASVDSFSQVVGKGVQGFVTFKGNRKKVAVGSASFVKDTWKQSFPCVEKQEEESCSFLLIEDALFVIEFSDEIRKEAYALIDHLHQERKMETFMLTGDQEKTATKVAKALSIGVVFSNLNPEDKLHLVSNLSEDKGLIMVGDGMNDAPSLIRATVGISLGQIGSAAAIQAADAVLLNDNIENIYWLLQKSGATVRIIRQNLFLALGAIIFASSFALLGLMPLWLSVILHEGGTVLVGFNSLRLLQK